MCRRDLAIVLVSGGMDSAVTASVAALDHSLAFLHVRYGQRTQEREERAFRDICAHFRPSRTLTVDLPALAAIGGSALTDRSIAVPRGGSGGDGIPVTYVPFRNAHFLAVAVSWAEVVGARKVYIGAVEEDSAGYPDCRKQFYDAFQTAVDRGTRPGSGIEIVTPVIGRTKPDIVKMGVHLGTPFNLTWSCYENGDGACGICDSCLLRLKGFREAGVDDSIPYAKENEGVEDNGL